MCNHIEIALDTPYFEWYYHQALISTLLITFCLIIAKIEYINYIRKPATFKVTGLNVVAEAGLEPHDLRVMSPASYQLLHSAVLSPCTLGINGARDRT